LFVGVDFDNTIVSYDELMHAIAAGWGAIPAGTPKNKKQIRDCLRKMPDGEIVWQRLQATAYGSRIQEAAPAAGVGEFFAFCKRRGIPVCIISHKTEYSNLGESGVNLRTSAMGWLRRRGLVAGDACGIKETEVYFEPTRSAKVGRVKTLGVTHFIDDLEETFEDPGFPPEVRRILYANATPRDMRGITSFAAWSEILDYFEREADPAHAKVAAGRD
jgi:hypothetical protein